MHSDLLKETSHTRPKLPAGPLKAPRSVAPSRGGRAVDEEGLQQTLSGVNTGSTIFSIELSSLARPTSNQASFITRKSG